MRIGVTAGVLVVFGAVSLGGAEYYTSRPQFCGTCHVMDPYYQSWTRDVHGAKFGVACVDCHYAPGEQHTINAKFRGLSQVASYFSGRYGSARPRAHVDDASCLRSGCHGGEAFAPKMLLIGEPRAEKRWINDREVEVLRSPSVHFVHDRHLDVEEKQAEVERSIAELKGRLKTGLGGPAFARIEQLAMSVKAAALREAALKQAISELSLDPGAATDALELQRLEHRRIRLDQLAGLNCSACHAFNATLATHITADRQVCFTCHFSHEEFNRETGECLRCHEPPQRAVQVHAPTSATAAATPGVLMDHADIVRRGVDCASCHADVIRGDAAVTERDCQHCHDQARFLEEFATRTTETVRKYHAVHIARQKAHCFDCHRAVKHGLAAGPPTMTDAGFLEPVLDDCKHCHPNHHREQVSLLAGTGGAGIPHALPNPMVGSRLNCRACHTEEGGDSKGDALVKATREGCIACHSADYLSLFDQWKFELSTYLQEAEASLARVEEDLKQRQVTSPETATLLEAIRQNLQLVRRGGGMHNRAFSLQLLDQARRDLARLEAPAAPVE